MCNKVKTSAASEPEPQARAGPFRAFAMLGRSKLLLFADRTCRALRSLLTLESGSLQVSRTQGEPYAYAYA